MIDPSIIQNMFPEYCYNRNMYYATYDVIDFERLLEHLFPRKDLFINDNKLIEKIRRTEDEIKENGILTTVNLDSIFYYQKEVGISGPRHADENDPKSIIEVDGKMILLNGYHRTLINISKGEKTIDAYVLKIDI